MHFIHLAKLYFIATITLDSHSPISTHRLYFFVVDHWTTLIIFWGGSTWFDWS